MDEDREYYKLSDDFIRQRRNLIIITIFIFFINFTTIEVDNISIFGISFDIVKKSNDLFISLYFVWVYFLIRYLQFFYQEGFLIFKSAFKSIYQKKITKKIKLFISIKEPSSWNESYNLNHERIKENNYVYKGEKRKKTNEYGEEVKEIFSLEIPKSLYSTELLRTIIEVIFFKSLTTDILLPFILVFLTFVFINI